MSKENFQALKDNSINFYIIGIIVILLVIYEVANSIEPIDDTKLDFFEATRLMGFGAVAIFAFIVARRYWGSDVFGRAYIALGIGYALYFVGDLLWYVYEIGYQVANPYPYYPDIGYMGFFPFAIYHLRTNIKYFKRHLGTEQKLIIILLPLVAGITFSIFSLIPVDASMGITNLKVLPTSESAFNVEFLTSLAYIIVVSFIFAYAIIGAQVFRNTVLGSAWGLILVGIALEAIADYFYYYQELFTDYDRQSPIHGLWMGSTMIICYALYRHRSL